MAIYKGYKDIEKRRAYNREYHRAYQKKTKYKWPKLRIQKIKEFIKEAKNKPCVDCGVSYPPYVMDFDHVRGKKKFLISLCVKRASALLTIQKEMDKCDVVCSNCHRERTHGKRKNGVIETSYAKYFGKTETIHASRCSQS